MYLFFYDSNSLLKAVLLKTRSNLLAMMLSAEFEAVLKELILEELGLKIGGHEIQEIQHWLDLVKR